MDPGTLSSSVRLSWLSATSSSSTATVSGTILDMSGYSGVLFLSGVKTANAGNTLKAQASTANSTSTMEDLTGTSVGVGSSDEGLWLDVYRPSKRYIRPLLLRGGAATVAGPIVALQYSGHKLPITNTSSGSYFGEAHVSPSTGTA